MIGLRFAARLRL